MSESIITEIKKVLLTYEEGIEDNKRHYESLYLSGRYLPIKPYCAKKHLFDLFNALNEKTDEYRELKTEFDRITHKLEIFEGTKGRVFRDKLFSDLKKHIQSYQSYLDSFPLPDEPGFIMEFENLINCRDYIAILVFELRKDYNLQTIEQDIFKLDSCFKKHFSAIIDVVFKEIEFIEHPQDPDDVWWRHPSKILAEKQARMKQHSE